MEEKPGRARRLRRFVSIVLLVTVGIQVPTVLVAGDLLARTGLPDARWWVLIVAFALTVQFLLRFRPGQGDRPRSWLGKHLVDLPFFVHWCSSFVFAPLAVVIGLVGTIVSAARGQ